MSTPEPWHCVQLHYVQDASRGKQWRFETLIHLCYRNYNVFFPSDCLHPLFTSTNWTQWWPGMPTYIEASGCSWAMDFSAPMLDPKADKEERDFYIVRTKVNSTILNNPRVHQTLFLRLPKEQVHDWDHHCWAYQSPQGWVHCPQNLWHSRTVQRTSGNEDRPILTPCTIPQQSNQPLHPSLCCRYKFPTNIQVVPLLAKLPQSMNVITQIIAQAKDSTGKPKTPTVEEIRAAAVLSWDQHHMKEMLCLVLVGMSVDSIWTKFTLRVIL